LDRAPSEQVTQLQAQIEKVEDVTEVRRIRMRRAGNKLFADIVIGAPRTFTFEQIHEVSEHVEKAATDGAHAISPQSEIDVVVHVEPTTSPSESVIDQIHYLADLQGVHAHDIHVREVSSYLEADFDVELPANMDLAEAHTLATRLEQAVLQSNKRVHRVTTHLEAPDETVVRRQDVTSEHPEMATRICQITDKIIGKGSAHDVHLYRSRASAPLAAFDNTDNYKPEKLDLMLHTIFDAHAP